MIDSTDVLMVVKIVYTIYALIAISIVGWYAMLITKSKESELFAKKGVFWSYVATLAIIGMGMHFLTYKTLPWVSTDLNRATITPSKIFEIQFKNHQMIFSETPMQVECNQYVMFNAVSEDLTYGFGIFRNDHTMVAQMQVVPHGKNDLMWKFEKNGTYYVRSTEYSGPKGHNMVEKDILVVSGCNDSDQNALTGGM